jgi:hypothetical protein
MSDMTGGFFYQRLRRLEVQSPAFAETDFEDQALA